MKVSKEQVAAHRARILAAAARLFRLRGFDDVTVAEVMKEAGLTHGAFYGHFPSKEALIAEAIEWVLAPAPDGAGRACGRRPMPMAISARAIATIPRSGCTFSSLGTEAARGSADLRRVMTESDAPSDRSFQRRGEGGRAHEKRRAAIAAWSAMVGAMVLARIVDDDKLSQEILAETRASLPFA